ncbi:MAG: DUF1653 domain-containing protein [Lachnospiraceae bacterium]
MIEDMPRAGERFRHFKGNLYQIVTLAEHSETGETLVIYQALYGEYKVYARPLSLFLSKVQREEQKENVQELRFTKIEIEQEKQEEPVVKKNARPKSEQEVIMAFLDTDTYEEKYHCLSSVHEFLSDRLIDTLAAALDVVIPEGELEERYNQLSACITTFRRFESNRR